MSQAAIYLHEPLSAPRIGGIAIAMAMHVVAFMLLMAPMSYAPPVADVQEDIIVPVFDEPEKIKETEPVPINVITKQEVMPLIKTPTAAPKPEVPPIIFAEGGVNDTPYSPPQAEHFGDVIAPPSGPISLSTEFAPAPKYPIASLRNGEEGTVLLLVKVGADGMPIDATIKKSSGHRELDKNAMKHVLATWRFYPAMHQGMAIPALALVPVNYTINE